MHSIFHLVVNNLNFLVGATFVVSLLSLILSVVQVRTKAKANVSLPEAQVRLPIEHEFKGAPLPEPAEAQVLPQIPAAVTAQEIIIDTITMAALSGIQVATLRRALQEQANRANLEVIRERMGVDLLAIPHHGRRSQQQEVGQGGKDDDFKSALIGRAQLAV